MIEEILSLSNLKGALKEIKDTKGIDNLSLNDFSEFHLKELYESLMNGTYVPEPMKKIDFKKDEKTRPISIPSIKDKIVQRVLSNFSKEDLLYNL